MNQFRKVINGEMHKLCTGPAHESPIYLPATEKYFYRHKSGRREGKLVSRCRLCVNWGKLKSPGSNHGWIPADQVRKFYIELDNRIGIAEISRRTGIDKDTLRWVIVGTTKRVQKAKFRLVMLELISARRKNEWVTDPLVKFRLERRTKEIARERQNRLANEEKSLRASYG